MKPILVAALILSTSLQAAGEVRRWRVGDGEHPWNLVPVSGRLTLGRGWAVEILVDDDGDGLVDEDPVELVDDDGDALFNEDPPEPEIDDDGDGLVDEDPVDNIDNDGDGLVDEDAREDIDDDLDGLVDEDGPDPQSDDDGDGLVGEDGRMTNGDDDYDGARNEDPPNGIDDDGDGLVDEDGPRPLDDPARGITTWIAPIHLDATRNLATLLNERYLEGEFGGIVPGKAPLKPFMLVPSELGFRNEGADPISGDSFETGSFGIVARVDYEKMVDGDIFTAYGSAEAGGRRGEHRGGAQFNLMGFYYINRIVFRPRPTLPTATIANYWIIYGDPSTVDPVEEIVTPRKILVPEVRGQFNPVVKDLHLDPPVLMGRIDILSRDPKGRRVETAEAALYGTGFATDASFTSEIIDIGPSRPRPYRFSRQIELFAQAERDQFEAEFPPLEGTAVNWGKVRWRGRQLGSGGNMRIQFRAGNALDTHIYARRLGPGLEDTRDEEGHLLDLFSWIKLTSGRIPQKELQYNELGKSLGADGTRGWSFWSAPFKFEDGLIDERLPEEEWRQSGVQLPLPGGTRYIQFRIWFDSTVDGAVMLDFIEFDYSAPLISGGAVAEIFPPRVVLGERTTFHYFLRPLFSAQDSSSFNRIEIDLPDLNTRIDTLRLDGVDWEEIPAADGADPLLAVSPRRLAPPPGQADSLGQFAQAVVLDPHSGLPKLMVKIPPVDRTHFAFDENIEIVFSSRLFRGSQQFSGSVWNDARGQGGIEQPVAAGNASPDVATDAVTVVAEIGGAPQKPVAVPNPFTPNGDGVNDEVLFQLELFLVLHPVYVQVHIYDLSGERVRTLGPAKYSAGSVQLAWDGRDDDGRRLPPGIYAYRFAVESDESSPVRPGTVALVY